MMVSGTQVNDVTEQLSNHGRYLMSKQRLSMPLGEILQAAGLVSAAHIEVALLDQIKYPDLIIGEILALRGWIKQETANFFAEEWPTILESKQKQPLLYYIQKAALLNQRQIEQLLAEQKHKYLDLTALVIFNGWLSQKTLNFLQKSLFSQESSKILDREVESEVLTIRENHKLKTKTSKRLEDALTSLELSLETLEREHQQKV